MNLAYAVYMLVYATWLLVLFLPGRDDKARLKARPVLMLASAVTLAWSLFRLYHLWF